MTWPAGSGPGGLVPSNLAGRLVGPERRSGPWWSKLATENDWGAPRITGALQQLGIAISERTVQRILEREFPDGRPEPTQGWTTFVRNHLPGTWACDFFTVTTLRFETLYVFFLIRLDTREVVHANVTNHPTGDWTTQQLRNACLEHEPPQRLIRDRDKKFVASFDQIVTGSGGEVLLTPPLTPVANAYAERMVGTFRRELFDRVIPRNEDHVRQLLRDFLAHYHRGRPHQGVGQLTPVQVRRGEQLRIRDPVDLDLGSLVVTPVLNGLVHEYTLAA